MGSIFSVRLPDEYDSYLRMESEKRKIPVGEILREIVGSFISGDPFVSSLTDIDLKLKLEKLDHEIEKKKKTIEQTLKLKNDREFFEKHGYYPTKPTTYVERVAEKPIQKTWHGSNYGSDFAETKPVSTNSYTVPKKEPTVEQLNQAYDFLTNGIREGVYGCQECSQVFHNKEEMPAHFHKNHATALNKYLARFQL